ncbi:hypothetical protein [Nocardioides sp. Root140]|uniref:hypothetical protein n=1 Tax=Nocardioides sp. Root140 TaxID=1736460 RepID=UPI000700CA55|nr:hypothetical protein [Nocardioides sp. Root140]KQY64109.1 hypothetical protein ASD30_03865 [Nocardioides sp. Root140]
MQKHTLGLIAGGTGLAVVGGGVLAVVLLTGSGGVDAALEVLPADTTNLTYVDRDGFAERAGVDDIGHDASEKDLDRYFEATRDSAAATPLSRYLVPMKDAAINEFDVDWYVVGRNNDDGYGNVYRLDDDVDFGDLGDDLEDAGYDKDEVSGHPRYTADMAVVDTATGMIGGRYPQDLRDVTLLEDEHLMVATGSPEEFIEVIDGDADSLSDSDDVADLLDQADSPEFAEISVGDGVRCGPGLGRNLPPEQLEQAARESGTDGLGHPEATGIFVVADGDDATAVSALVFGSGEDAEDDADARKDWLEHGTDPFSLRPNTDYFDLDSVSADGSVVVVEGDYENGAATAVQMAAQGSGPGACSG